MFSQRHCVARRPLLRNWGRSHLTKESAAPLQIYRAQRSLTLHAAVANILHAGLAGLLLDAVAVVSAAIAAVAARSSAAAANGSAEAGK